MDPLNPVFAIAATIVAVASAFVLAKVFGVPSDKGRYAPIDGLRGYLAFCVFIHHSSVWYFFVRGEWRCPSALYTMFGGGGVTLFFMITGFLFFSKILDAKQKPIDWLRLYVSRLLRLTPLYMFMLVGLLLIVACISNFSRNEPLSTLAKDIACWAGFTIFGRPDLNGVTRTYLITAGVTWTLIYEWAFYCSLPLLALLLRRSVSLSAVVFSLVALTTMALCRTWAIGIFPDFLGGMVAALLVRNKKLCTLASSKMASLAVLACLLAALVVQGAPPHVARELCRVMTFAIAFAIIACGNTLFGILTIAPARFLGEISYSLYLLHGMLLCAIFKLAVGFHNASRWTPVEHWTVILGITPVLIFMCCLTFRGIETPCLQSTTRVTTWIRSCLSIPRWRQRRALEVGMPPTVDSGNAAETLP